MVVPLGAQGPLGHPKPEEGIAAFWERQTSQGSQQDQAEVTAQHLQALCAHRVRGQDVVSHHPRQRAEVTIAMTCAHTLPEPHGPALPRIEASFLRQACWKR